MPYSYCFLLLNSYRYLIHCLLKINFDLTPIKLFPSLLSPSLFHQTNRYCLLDMIARRNVQKYSIVVIWNTLFSNLCLLFVHFRCVSWLWNTQQKYDNDWKLTINLGLSGLMMRFYWSDTSTRITMIRL
jgi:hypothetical protein